VARFVFQLEAVLEQRRLVEQQRQRAVAELEVRRMALEGTIRGYQRAIAQEREEQRVLLKAGRIMDARAQAAASVRLGAAAQRGVVELSGVLARLDAARAELLEATKRRKAVERLREKRLEAWRAEQNRREAMAVDELVVMRSGRAEDAA
jgi:flagellar protein FliJ